jgi:hypothetical protein
MGEALGAANLTLRVARSAKSAIRPPSGHPSPPCVRAVAEPIRAELEVSRASVPLSAPIYPPIPYLWSDLGLDRSLLPMPVPGAEKKISWLSFLDEFVSSWPDATSHIRPANRHLRRSGCEHIVYGLVGPSHSGRKLAITVDELSADTPAEKTRQGGRPKREAMTLTLLHQKFLLHCEVERQTGAANDRVVPE